MLTCDLCGKRCPGETVDEHFRRVPGYHVQEEGNLVICASCRKDCPVCGELMVIDEKWTCPNECSNETKGGETDDQHDADGVAAVLAVAQ